MRRRRLWIIAAAIAALMILFPPWSGVGPRIVSAGYGFLFTGPFLDDWDSFRLDGTRLFYQLALVAIVAGGASAVFRPRAFLAAASPVIAPTTARPSLREIAAQEARDAAAALRAQEDRA